MQNYTQEILAGFDDVKQARYITLEEQKEFSDFIANVGINSDKLDWCASDYQKRPCVSGFENHSKKVTYLLCGSRGLCPRCSMGYATSKANERYEFIKRNISDRVDFDLKMNQIVLTLPESLHDLDKVVFSKMIKQFMIKFDIHAYGYVIQTRHSSNPLGKPYHHVHILSLNFKEENKKIVRCDYFFDTDKMRNAWKTIIEKNTKISIDGDVNLKTSYSSVSKEKQKCIHLLKYVYRYALEDLFKVQVRDHSINYVQKWHFKDVRDRVLNLINERKPNVVWCGLLASTKQKELQEMISEIGYDWQSLKQVRTDLMIKANTCPCGLPFAEKPCEVGKYQGDNEPVFPT